MKALKPWIAATAIALLPSCTTPTITPPATTQSAAQQLASPEPELPESGEAASTPYFPLRTGLSYSYEFTINGRKFGTHRNIVDRLTRRGDVVIAHLTNTDHMIDAQSMKFRETATSTFTYLRKPAELVLESANFTKLTFKLPLVAGDSWKDAEGNTVSVEKGEVTTFLGHFKDVLKVRKTDENGESTVYYAKDIGLVKSESEDNGHKTTVELIEFNDGLSNGVRLGAPTRAYTCYAGSPRTAALPSFQPESVRRSVT